MQSIVTQSLISIMIVAILALLWRARHEQFAQIGRSWNYILWGSIVLAVGEIANLFFRFLLQQDVFSADLVGRLIPAGHTLIILGLFVLALGVYRWLSAAQSLIVKSASAIQRDSDLRERISRDGMLLSTVPAALYRTSGSLSADASDIVFVNDKIEDLLGYSVSEFEADPLLFGRLMHVDDARRFEGERKNLWDKDSLVIEHQFRHKNGGYRWIRRHLKQIKRGNGDRAEWHGCAFDVTDLKQAEGRLINFLDSAPDALIAIREDGKIVMANVPATALFGYNEQELLGMHVKRLLPEDARNAKITELLDYFENPNAHFAQFERDHFGRRKDGTTFPAEIRLSPLGTEETPIVICCVRDITRLIETEAQLRQAQKMQSVGQLTGGIAHDFNNMLTVVIGNLQLLERAARDNSEMAHPVQAAMDASMRAAELVKRLLAFSRRQLLAPKNTRINELIREVEPLLRRTITEEVVLKTKLAQNLWLARIDPSQLENALVNLALNARDAMLSHGRLTIETSNTVLDETYTSQTEDLSPGDYVLIAVSDNGEGIPEDSLPHVFEPFYSTKEVGKGSGLGLSMVYGFVKQSKGHIKIYSEPARGTTIKIYIPRSDSSQEDRVGHTTRNRAVPCGDETILLVEDDDGVRDIALSLLQSLGYKVLHANCGQNALDVIADHPEIDLLFTDIVMPGGMTGTDLAREVLNKNPNLKVLYTSGYTDTAVFDNQLLEHGSEMLNKPYRKEQLAQAVRNVLDSE